MGYDSYTIPIFLMKLAVMIKSSSGQSYATISMQPLIFDSLISHCKDAKKQVLGAVVITSLHKSAESIKQKIENYKPHRWKAFKSV